MKKVLFLGVLFLTVAIWFFANEKNKKDYLIAEDARKQKTSELLQEQIEENISKEAEITIQTDEDILIFPSYNYRAKVKYVNCKKILDKTPKSIKFAIYGDSVIDLAQYDSRLSIKLKFNKDHLFKEHGTSSIFIESIDILKGNKNSYNLDFNPVFQIEAFPDEDGRVYKEFELVDINMDTYLDLVIEWICGKACYDSYWLYDVEKETFILNPNLNYLRPYCFDCESKIVYSYRGGTAYGLYFDAFKIIDNTIEPYQKLYRNYSDDFCIETYRGTLGKVLRIDTTGVN